jgi:Asp-tRNA(Asn)/Glu-tRNA(Gln) amidotransferase A subunit family amidase
MLEAFAQADLILAPATPFPALEIGQKTISLAGRELPARPNIGVLAQPFSCIGLPVCTAPVFEPGSLPIGVQLIAPPWREDLCLRAAHALEKAGTAIAHPPGSRAG